jgi:aspartyl-tRNA(Asn)/glutamyl-tRNA(Gln) amidotransferase subunit B
MEKGTLRCDANISLKEKGVEALGTKTELKNMNSFKSVKEALAFEIKRQAQLLSQGLSLQQQTRLWDEEKLITRPMRTKEEAMDYRYFPEPDLPAFVVSQEDIQKIKETIPELPLQRLKRLIEDYRLSPYEAGILVSDKEWADYFEDCIRAYSNPKVLSNWIIGPLLCELNNRALKLSQLGLSPDNLCGLIRLVDEGIISNLAAKAVLTEMIDTDSDAASIVQKKNLAQISDTQSLQKEIEAAIRDNYKSVQDYRAGKSNALMFLVGQVMKRTKGRANPKVVQEILKQKL